MITLKEIKYHLYVWEDWESLQPGFQRACVEWLIDQIEAPGMLSEEQAEIHDLAFAAEVYDSPDGFR